MVRGSNSDIPGDYVNQKEVNVVSIWWIFSFFFHFLFLCFDFKNLYLLSDTFFSSYPAWGSISVVGFRREMTGLCLSLLPHLLLFY